jgi:hypothetical protein
VPTDCLVFVLRGRLTQPGMSSQIPAELFAGMVSCAMVAARLVLFSVKRRRSRRQQQSTGSTVNFDQVVERLNIEGRGWAMREKMRMATGVVKEVSENHGFG